ncbi:cation:proton antiporter [Agromyces sp. Marseille-P2726]|uniref:cation:proton antiporter n=1 Tax=Agromyces sp. Marseille-P2726 TaxID=2709132 RepID=UPI001570BFF1|nr:cation:proton antiporter [Agromyces sp. Marseille-P2726]
MEISTGTLVLIPAIAVAAPLLVKAVGRWFATPLVVFEILLGLVLGPAVLGWVVPDEFAAFLSEFGLAMLFFLAGNEVDFRTVRGRPIRRAAIGWTISLVAGFGIAALVSPHLIEAAFVAVCLTSTALGTIMPILRDTGDLRTPFGISVLALGAIGEFAPLLAISLFLSGRSPLVSALVLTGFAAVAGLAIWLASRGAGHYAHRLISATLHTSGQFGVRLLVLVLAALVALSLVLELDLLLGAFTAGVLARLIMSGAPDDDVEILEGKIEGLGYGFFVPIFFIYTGVTFDLESLVEHPATVAIVPAFLLLLLVVRGIPSMLAAPPRSSRRDRVAIGLFGATGLPIIVAVTAIGVEHGDLSPGTAAALVGAGMLSVLIFPLVALAVRDRPVNVTTPRRGEDAELPTDG